VHVLIIPSWYPDNEQDLNGVFFREQAKALVRAGHRVGVIAPMFRSPREGVSVLASGFGNSFWQDGTIPTLRAHSIFVSSRLPHFDIWRWCARGEALFNRYVAWYGRPDIIHAHSLLFGGVLAARISQQTAIPFGVTEHSSTFARNLVRNWQVPGLVNAASEARFRLAVSRALTHAIAARLGPMEWDILPNMLDPLFETKPPTREKRAWDQPFRLVSVASLNAIKGFDLLLIALAKARQNGLLVKLSIGGEGPERAALEAQVERLALGSAVHFLGALSRKGVLDALSQADAFVLASHHETFGIVFIEALSQGLPVIATRSGGPEDIVTASDGLLVPTGDTNALAKAIAKVASQIETYDSAELRMRALARFSEVSFINRLNAIYERAVGARAG